MASITSDKPSVLRLKCGDTFYTDCVLTLLLLSRALLDCFLMGDNFSDYYWFNPKLYSPMLLVTLFLDYYTYYYCIFRVITINLEVIVSPYITN